MRYAFSAATMARTSSCSGVSTAIETSVPALDQLRAAVEVTRRPCPTRSPGQARGWLNDSLRASFNHLRHGEEFAGAGGGVGENRSRHFAVGHDVLAHLHLHGDDRGHRLDAGDIDLVQLLDETEDRIEVG